MLSYFHDPSTILARIKHHVQSHRVTVLVTHWWEYFRDGNTDERFVHALHETADYLADSPDIKVVSFADINTSEVVLN